MLDPQSIHQLLLPCEVKTDMIDQVGQGGGTTTTAPTTSSRERKGPPVPEGSGSSSSSSCDLCGGGISKKDSGSGPSNHRKLSDEEQGKISGLIRRYGSNRRVSVKPLLMISTLCPSCGEGVGSLLSLERRVRRMEEELRDKMDALLNIMRINKCDPDCGADDGEPAFDCETTAIKKEPVDDEEEEVLDYYDDDDDHRMDMSDSETVHGDGDDDRYQSLGIISPAPVPVSHPDSEELSNPSFEHLPLEVELNVKRYEMDDEQMGGNSGLSYARGKRKSRQATTNALQKMRKYMDLSSSEESESSEEEYGVEHDSFSETEEIDYWNNDDDAEPNEENVTHITIKPEIQERLEMDETEYPFGCDICNKKYKRNDHLNRHLTSSTHLTALSQRESGVVPERKNEPDGRIGNLEKPYNLLGQNEKPKKKLQGSNGGRKVILSNKGPPFRCPLPCGKSFDDITERDKHHRKVHWRQYQNKTLRCKPCRKKFKDLHSYRKHILTAAHKEMVLEEIGEGEEGHKSEEDPNLSSEGPPYLCTCRKSFRRIRERDHHYHFGKCDLRCPYCNERFEAKEARDEHILSVNCRPPSQRLRCEICDVTFIGKDSYRVHVNTLKHRTKIMERDGLSEIPDPKPIRNDENLKVQLNDDGPPFFCTCGKSYDEKKHRDFHYLVTHRRKSQISCIPCGKKFPGRNGIRYHIKSIQHRMKMMELVGLTEDEIPHDDTSTSNVAREETSILSNEGPPFLCRCGKSFVDISEREKHRRRVHWRDYSNKEFCCEPCGWKFKDLHGYRKHTLTLAHKENISKGLEQGQGQPGHNSSSEGPPFSCGCGKSFKRKRERDNHYHFGRCDLRCLTCKERFDTKEECDQHVASSKHFYSAFNHPIRCDLCDMELKDKRTYRDHVNTLRHRTNIMERDGLTAIPEPTPIGSGAVVDENPDEELNDEGPPFLCSCGKSYEEKKHRDFHYLVTHRRKSQLECIPCDRKFHGSNGMRYHMKTFEHRKKIMETVGLTEIPHDDDVMCETCGKGFHTFRLYRYHILTAHTATGEGEHQCDQCGKKCKTRSLLYNHVRTHLRSEQCDKCGKRFAAMNILRKHILHVHEPKESVEPKKCSYCDKSFRSRTGLRKHVKRDHTHPPQQQPLLLFDLDH